VSLSASVVAPASAAASAPALRSPPPGYVDLAVFIPGIALDIRYATRDNFTGAPLPGYELPGAWMREEAAQALAKVQETLRGQGLGLVIFDAYRPARASLAMAEWADKTGQSHLLRDGYIAKSSGHNLGNTVDLGVIDLATDRPIEMGTPFDTFSKDSWTNSATGDARQNRFLLRDAMRAEGFSPYAKEWWHFSYPVEKTSRIDIPYSAAEPSTKGPGEPR
jgi:D-alanyl-D-alanine dipeptidase